MFYNISTWVIPVLLAITLHESAHGYVAHYLGDNTAKEQGRISLNPMRHIDLFGTVLLPLLLAITSPFVFGWAKPIPVNFGRLRRPKQDMVWVAAAGPATNLFLALVSARLMYIIPMLPDLAGGWAFDTLRNSLFLNIILCVFNLLPIPPLDGGRIAVGLLPMNLARSLARLEKYGMILILFAIIGLPWLGSLIGLSINPFGWLILPVVNIMSSVIANLAGLL